MKLHLLLLSIFSLCSCTNKEHIFSDDLKLLKQNSEVQILKNEDAIIVVSAQWQGRVFTSSAKGMNGKSLGYFNRDIIKSKNASRNLSKLGGESRFWFGPEIGRYSLFFENTESQTANNIVISPELNTRHFTTFDKNEQSITSAGEMNIRNASGYLFHMNVERKISLLSQNQIEKEFQIKLPDKIASVAFSANTTIVNKNKKQWNKEEGLISIWELSCIPPTPQTTVIIPTSKPMPYATIYFTNIDEKRIKITPEAVYYKADANYMNKIGIQPEYCKNVFGSYSPESNMLTIVKYHLSKSDTLYVNSCWGHKEPYKGDVINIFNGEVNNMEKRNWPFYEMETSSAAKELKSNELMSHKHSVFHFIGNKNKLNKICKEILGVDLQSI